MTEVIDDVVFARAPIDADGAFDLIGRRDDRRLPTLLTDSDRLRAADFLARFSPWRNRPVGEFHL